MGPNPRGNAVSILMLVNVCKQCQCAEQIVCWQTVMREVVRYMPDVGTIGQMVHYMQLMNHGEIQQPKRTRQPLDGLD